MIHAKILVGIFQISALKLILIFVCKRLSVAALLWFGWDACVVVTSWCPLLFDWLIFLVGNVCTCGIACGKSSWRTLDNFSGVMQCCVVVSAACLAAFCWFCFSCLLLKQFEQRLLLLTMSNGWLGLHFW